jgi:hypothetical protein
MADSEESRRAPENLLPVQSFQIQMDLRHHGALWLGTLPYALIAAGALLRLAPHPPNFAPIGALALFGGGVLPRPWGVVVPLAAMALSDIRLGFGPGTAWVYASFVLIALLGSTALRRRNVLRIVGTSVGASLLFYAVTNFGEWLGPLYPHTPTGLAASYIAAIPFFRNTALSDLGYTLALFGIHESVLRLVRRPARVSTTAV